MDPARAVSRGERRGDGGPPPMPGTWAQASALSAKGPRVIFSFSCFFGGGRGPSFSSRVALVDHAADGQHHHHRHGHGHRRGVGGHGSSGRGQRAGIPRLRGRGHPHHGPDQRAPVSLRSAGTPGRPKPGRAAADGAAWPLGPPSTPPPPWTRRPAQGGPRKKERCGVAIPVHTPPVRDPATPGAGMCAAAVSARHTLLCLPRAARRDGEGVSLGHS